MIELIQEIVDAWNSHLILRSAHEELAVMLQVGYKPITPGARLTDYACCVHICKLKDTKTVVIGRRMVFSEEKLKQDCIELVARQLLKDIGIQGINNAFIALTTEMYEPVRSE